VGHEAKRRVASADARHCARTNDREIHSPRADRRCHARTRSCHGRAQRMWIRIREQRRVERREGGHRRGFERDWRTNEQDPVSKWDGRDADGDETIRDDVDHELDLCQRARDADDRRHDRLRWRSVMVGLGPDRLGGCWCGCRDLHRRPTSRKVDDRRFATGPRRARDSVGREHPNRDSVSRAGLGFLPVGDGEISHVGG
jgi:hypothetical protein